MLKVAAAITALLVLVVIGVASGRVDRPSAAVEVILRDDGTVRPASAEEIAEWCGGPEGRKLNALYGQTLGSGDPARIGQITDEALEIADSAPAGAPCAANLLTSLAGYWELSAGEPGFEAVDPGEQVERIRDAQRENGLGGTPGG